jgi:hypothetical protein
MTLEQIRFATEWYLPLLGAAVFLCAVSPAQQMPDSNPTVSFEVGRTYSSPTGSGRPLPYVVLAEHALDGVGRVAQHLPGPQDSMQTLTGRIGAGGCEDPTWTRRALPPAASPGTRVSDWLEATTLSSALFGTVTILAIRCYVIFGAKEKPFSFLGSP